jgi:parallel beta-helix repeat protein
VPQQYATIQAALADASEGDTIRVGAGSYLGPVGVGLPVILETQGNGAVVIQEGPSGDTRFAMVLTPASSGATVRGFTLRGTRSVLTGSPAHTGKRTRLENLLIEGAGNSTCINLSDSHDVEIVNSVLRVSFGGIAVGSLAPSRRTLLSNLTLHFDPASPVGGLGIAANLGSQLSLQNITLDSQNPGQSFVGPVQGLTVRQSSSDPANPFSSIQIDGFHLQIPLANTLVAGLLVSEVSDFLVRNLTLDIGPTPNRVTAPRVGLGIFASPTRQNQIRVENARMNFAALDPGTASNGSIGMGISSVGNASLTNCTVRNGDFGILMSDASNITVSDCSVSNVTQFAFAANGVQPGDTIVNGEITRCRAENSFMGVLTNSTTVPELLVRNCLLTRNTFGCGANDGTTRLLNSVVGGNQIGILGLVGVIARNNQLFANGVSIQGAVLEDFNNFFANGAGDAFSGANSRSQDPLFLDIIDFLLAPASPSIDAGDTDPNLQDRQPPGQGGARNDIGAYGGPAAAIPLGARP